MPVQFKFLLDIQAMYLKTKIPEIESNSDKNIFAFGIPDFCYFGCTVQYLKLMEFPLVLKVHHVLFTGKISTSPNVPRPT